MKYTPCTPLWVKFGYLEHLTLVGRDAVCMGMGCHMIFLSLTTNEEMLYRADSFENGEGISRVTGHKAVSVFAFAEKRLNPRIFIKTYPGFKEVNILLGGIPEGCLNLRFGDSSELFSISNLPTFLITLWNWRTGEKITVIKSDILEELQILRVNAHKPLCLAQLGVQSFTLYIWDILISGPQCFVTKHPVIFNKNNPPLMDCLWNSEGTLFALDIMGNIYMMTPEYELEMVIESSTKMEGYYSMVWFKGGIVVGTPNHLLLHYKKSGVWYLDWSHKHTDHCKFLLAGVKEYLLALTDTHEALRFVSGEDKFVPLKPFESEFNELCMIYPTGEYVVTLGHQKQLTMWQVETGKKMCVKTLRGTALAMKENPEFPYVAVAFEHGSLELFSLYDPEKITWMTTFALTRNPLSSVYFTEIGRFIVTADMNVGQFFIIEGIPGTKMQVIATVEAQQQIADYILVASRTCLRLFLLGVTSNSFITGKNLIRYCIIKDKPEADKKQYKLQDDTTMYSKLYATTNPNRDRVFHAIPFRSSQIHEIETKRADPYAKVTKVIQTGHQLKKFALTIDKHHVVSYGYDGLVIVHTKDQKEIGFVMPHHRRDGGTIKAYIDPLSKYIVSLGRDNTLVCTTVDDIEINTEKQEELKNLLQSPKYALMFKRATGGFEPKGEYEGKTWLEVEAIKRELKEREECAEERSLILLEFQNIQFEISKLLTENLEGPDNEKIDVQQFNLDIDFKDEMIAKSQEECRRTKKYLEELIVCQEKVTKWLKTQFWDKMQTPGKTLWAVFANFCVENYVLLPIDGEFKHILSVMEEQRKLEQLLSDEDSLEPWVPMTESEMHFKLLQPPTIVEEAKDFIMNLQDIDEEIEEEVTEVEKIDEETITAFKGSITHTFQDTNAKLYAQQQISTFLQTKFQTLLLENECYNLREYFNKQFNNIASQKIREMINIKDRNARLRHIISELNYFSVKQIHITIDDPEWKQEEEPEKIITVADSEIGITPYISPSQQAILDAEAAEAERIRLLLLADDFRERALMAMMNGVLEVRWEDELRKEVPIPKCMIEKEPEEYNEDDIRAVWDYEQKVKFLNSERERYKNILDAEYAKIGNIMRESVKKFNNRMADLLLMKLNVDSAICQETLKINRMRLTNHKKIMANMQEFNTKNEIAQNEASMEEVFKTLTKANEALNELRNQLDLLLAKEKLLEKAFKKDFADASPVVQEVTLKLYKRRPKASYRNVTSDIVLKELAKAVVGHEKSTVVSLSHDAVEFLKGMDHIDLYVGVPNAVDENAYAIVCKHRRLKIECEIKIKAQTMNITEAETTVALYQRTLVQKRELNAKLLQNLTKIRQDRMEEALNMELQIVFRKGIVEVETNGDISDFKDAILIPRVEVEEINKIIIRAGNRKLKAMRESMDFRKGIVLKEWEHKRLRMIIEDLEEKMRDVESLRLTKDIQNYLKVKTRGDYLDKQLTFEQEVDLVKGSFERLIQEKKYRVQDLQKQINKVRKENRDLDRQILDVNVDVCEYKLLKDDEMEKQEKELVEHRMKSLLKRTKLVSEIQENHKEILILQTELEIARLKIYPTLRYKYVSPDK